MDVLPVEIKVHICTFLDAQTLGSLARVSHEWYDIVMTPGVWKHVLSDLLEGRKDHVDYPLDSFEDIERVRAQIHAALYDCEGPLPTMRPFTTDENMPSISAIYNSSALISELEQASAAGQRVLEGPDGVFAFFGLCCEHDHPAPHLNYVCWPVWSWRDACRFVALDMRLRNNITLNELCQRQWAIAFNHMPNESAFEIGTFTMDGTYVSSMFHRNSPLDYELDTVQGLVRVGQYPSIFSEREPETGRWLLKNDFVTLRQVTKSQHAAGVDDIALADWRHLMLFLQDWVEDDDEEEEFEEHADGDFAL